MGTKFGPIGIISARFLVISSSNLHYFGELEPKFASFLPNFWLGFASICSTSMLYCSDSTNLGAHHLYYSTYPFTPFACFLTPSLLIIKSCNLISDTQASQKCLLQLAQYLPRLNLQSRCQCKESENYSKLHHPGNRKNKLLWTKNFIFLEENFKIMTPINACLDCVARLIAPIELLPHFLVQQLSVWQKFMI